MNYVSMIHEFIDGTLEAHKEEQLFMALASNDELRSEMKQFLEFEFAAKYDSEAYTPPVESTAAVFSRLGIDPMPAAGAAAGAAAVSTAGALTKSKYFLMITNMLSAVVAALAVWFLIHWSADSGANDISTTATQKANSDLFSVNQMLTGIPVMSSRSGDNVNTDSRSTKPLRHEKYVQTDQSPKQSVQKTVAKDSAATINNRNADFYSNNQDLMLKPSRLYRYGSEESAISHLQTDNAIPLQLSALTGNYPKSGWILEFKGSDYWAFPKATLQESSNPPFNNTSVAALYSVTDDIHIGLDFRQEYFFQKFEGTEDNDKYLYEQHTNYLSLGAALRCDIFEIQNISSFAQIGLSANQAGPIGRFMYGFEYSPSSDYGFILGVEGSVLRFHHGKETFYSPKIGFHYGILFKF